ncbi:MAG: hypothetical protein OXC40_02670 [Proteobacteria bacterium]|nr:hypothetical protein [Pseudomonadota bacterium]
MSKVTDRSQGLLVAEKINGIPGELSIIEEIIGVSCMFLRITYAKKAYYSSRLRFLLSLKC